jgi:hypothetical protein
MRITDNKAKTVGNKIVQDITYTQGTRQSKVTVERNSNGGNPKITDIEKKIK